LHCAFLGCPIVGDKVYGRRKPTLPLARHFLHASKIEIILPGQKKARIFESPLPDDLDRILAELRS
jgi:23S rRNA pseudouridine1911/1915/1917 synthase